MADPLGLAGFGVTTSTPGLSRSAQSWKRSTSQASCATGSSAMA